MCDTMSTRQATELRGDFDNSYLSEQSSVSVRSIGVETCGIKQVCVSKKFDLMWVFLTGMCLQISHYRFLLYNYLFPQHCLTEFHEDDLYGHLVGREASEAHCPST